MNDKFGPGSYRETGESPTDADRTLLSPDQEFETSGNYRQPPDDWAEQLEPSERPRSGFAGLGPKGCAPGDERIRKDICERLSWNDEVDASDVDVNVDSGLVLLEGAVETRYMKQVAQDLAERVPGVIEVRNALRVRVTSAS